MEAHTQSTFVYTVSKVFYMPTVCVTSMLLEEKVFRPLLTRTNLATLAGV